MFSEYHSGNGDTIIALVITVIVILHRQKYTLRCFDAEFGGFEFSQLDAARSHSGSDSRLRLSFIALVPLRYATGASFTTEPVRIPFAKQKRGFEFSQLDAARSGSALTCQRARHSLPSPFESRLQNKRGGFEFSRLDDARSGSALTCQRARHSLPSPFESRLQNKRGGFEFSRLDDARSGSALTCQRARHSLPSPFESPLPKQKGHRKVSFLLWRAQGDSNPRPTGS